MNRHWMVFLLFNGNCLAHPGHGAPLLHVHEGSWTKLAFWAAVGATVAVVAAWRAR